MVIQSSSNKIVGKRTDGTPLCRCIICGRLTDWDFELGDEPLCTPCWDIIVVAEEDRKAAAAQKTWYKANKDKAAAAQKTWYEANKDKVAAAQQAVRVESERPGRRAMEILRAMYDQGSVVFTNKDNTGPTKPDPGTKNIGWFYSANGTTEFYLNPTAAYQAIVEFAARSGDPFTIKPEALWKDLKRMGYTDCEEGRSTKVQKVFGHNKRLISLKAGRL